MTMEKLTTILGVVRDVESDAGVLDKCVALARTFRARLELLVRDDAQADACIAHCALRGLAGVDADVPSHSETLTEAVLRRVRQRAIDLVVKDLAANDVPRGWLSSPESTLAEECPVPLLLVRHRPWALEPRFAAAVDVADRGTESLARGILQSSGFLALGLEAWVDVLYSEREQNDQALRMERAVRIARLVREFHVGGERLQVFDGTPEKVLPALVRARQYDVLVVGGASRRGALRTLTGTLTSALVDACIGDVLLVNPEPREASSARRASGGEQLAHQRQQYA
jgi:nucleotide-binding universal stress UspA family protein